MLKGCSNAQIAIPNVDQQENGVTQHLAEGNAPFSNFIGYNLTPLLGVRKKRKKPEKGKKRGKFQMAHPL